MMKITEHSEAIFLAAEALGAAIYDFNEDVRPKFGQHIYSPEQEAELLAAHHAQLRRHLAAIRALTAPEISGIAESRT